MQRSCAHRLALARVSCEHGAIFDVVREAVRPVKPELLQEAKKKARPKTHGLRRLSRSVIVVPT